MAVRNFYLSASIDGRKTPLAGGPARKDGGFSLIITQRDKGAIRIVARIYGRVLSDGRLQLTGDLATDPRANFHIETER